MPPHVGVGVPVAVAVFVGVFVFVGVRVAVAVLVGVFVAVGVAPFPLKVTSSTFQISLPESFAAIILRATDVVPFGIVTSNVE